MHDSSVSLRRLIVTADDFGLSPAVNEAIERAHREGILTSASLMVGAPAAGDAIARAHRLPALKVGLHIVVVRGRALSPLAKIPHLVDARGNLPENLLRAGCRFFFHPLARRELAAEIRAQFEAFRASGLVLDHVNSHNHMHLHPTVLGSILRVGRDYGLPAMRVPFEPAIADRAASIDLRQAAANAFLKLWIALLRVRLRGAGVRCNDYLFGMADSGRMDRERVLRVLGRLPVGVSEMYLHPMIGPRANVAPHASEAEFDALVCPRVRAALREFGIAATTFSELAGAT